MICKCEIVNEFFDIECVRFYVKYNTFDINSSCEKLNITTYVYYNYIITETSKDLTIVHSGVHVKSLLKQSIGSSCHCIYHIHNKLQTLIRM